MILSIHQSLNGLHFLLRIHIFKIQFKIELKRIKINDTWIWLKNVEFSMSSLHLAWFLFWFQMSLCIPLSIMYKVISLSLPHKMLHSPLQNAIWNWKSSIYLYRLNLTGWPLPEENQNNVECGLVPVSSFGKAQMLVCCHLNRQHYWMGLLSMISFYCDTHPIVKIQIDQWG